MQVATDAAGPTPTAVRINVGGAAYTASTGATFLDDNAYFAGGNDPLDGERDHRHARPDAVPGRSLGSFSYAIPIANGTYDVKFHFAETFFTAPCAGSRIFSMDIVDTATSPDIANLDICALVGPNAALIRTISNVVVSDGILDIQSVTGAADTPVLSAIEVVAHSGGGSGPPPGPGAPVVTSTIPVDGATGVSPAIAVAATFSIPMDATTITGTSFTLKDSLNNPVPASVTYDAATTKATLTPTAGLKGATTYTASLAGTITASDSTPLETPFSWTFTTVPPTPLTVNGRTPANATNNVLQSAPNVTATFSRAVDAATVTSSSFTLAPDGDAPVAATVSYNAGPAPRR